MRGLTVAAGRVVGIDTSSESLDLARALAGAQGGCEFLEMDAAALAFGDAEFDAVVCIQIERLRGLGAAEERLPPYIKIEEMDTP